jgi:predicted amidohydrolase YtcJ
VFVNGLVWTGDAARPRVEALAIAGDRISAVGSSEEIRRLAGPATSVVDLKGRFLAPGFNDAHLHFLVVEQAELDGAETLPEVQHRLAGWARSHPASPWVTGRGWVFTAFPGHAPDRRHLDAVVADRPVLLRDRDGHCVLANTKALEMAGVTRDTPDPPNGIVVRDAAGAPTGLLKEAAAGLVSRHVPPPSSEDLYRALKRRLDQAASYGLTSVQNASALELPVFERVMAEGALTVRFYSALPLRKDPPSEELAAYKALRDKYRGPLFKLGAVKGFVDGVVDAKTAAMFEPFVGGGSGIRNWTSEELDRTVALYDREGFQIMLHAIGDRAIAQALDAYERAAKLNGTSGRRHRVEHIEVPRRADLPRFKALGVIASTQAIFAEPDQATLENYAVLLGPERSSRANAFRLFDDAGAVQAFGSDSPVFSMEVLRGIFAAVSRQTRKGTPPGGWYPENRISAEAALRHFTADAAYASFDEDAKGTLVPGKLADLVVLSEDIAEGPPGRILETRVLLTVMGGRDTFRSPEF